MACKMVHLPWKIVDSFLEVKHKSTKALTQEKRKHMSLPRLLEFKLKENKPRSIYRVQLERK